MSDFDQLIISRTNDCSIADTRAITRDNEPSIHQMAAHDGSSLAVASHLVSPTTNGYSNNECLPYNMNGENDAELSQCRLTALKTSDVFESKAQLKTELIFIFH